MYSLVLLDNFYKFSVLIYLQVYFVLKVLLDLRILPDELQLTILNHLIL